MKKGKGFAWNALCATVAWILYNTFFLLVQALYDLSTTKWDLGIEPMPVFYDTVAPVILLVLYFISFVGFFFLGKTMLAATGSHVFNFVSLALGYALLLALVGWAYCSEYTILGLTNFLIACMGDALNSKSIGDLFYDWSTNAFVMAIPFICMFIGLTVRQIQANKAIGGSDEKAAAGTDVEQTAEAAQSAAETDKPKGTP